jgi:transposase
VVSKTKQQEQLAALLKSITAKGTSIDQIAAMLKKGTGAGK